MATDRRDSDRLPEWRPAAAAEPLPQTERPSSLSVRGPLRVLPFSLASGRERRKESLGDDGGGGSGGVSAKPTHDIDFQLVAPTKPPLLGLAVTGFLSLLLMIKPSTQALPLG